MKTRSRVRTCVAKIGEPDLRNGMLTCGQPVTWYAAGEIVHGAPARSTGWGHVYDGITDHGAVPEEWA